MTKKIGISYTNYNGAGGEYWFTDDKEMFKYEDCVVEVSDKEYEFLKQAYEDWWTKARNILKKYYSR